MELENLEEFQVVLEDLNFIRDTVSTSNPKGYQARLLSPIARRLFLEGHLSQVANMTVGRIKIDIPQDLRAFANTCETVIAGIPELFKLKIPISGYVSIDYSPGDKNSGNIRYVLGDQNQPLTRVSVQSFMNDPIIRHEGNFVKRSDLIKYFCYKAFGAHKSKQETTVEFSIIDHFRYFLLFQFDKNGTFTTAFQSPGAKRTRHTAIDLAEALFLASLYYCVNSADVEALRQELVRLIAQADTPYTT